MRGAPQRRQQQLRQQEVPQVVRRHDTLDAILRQRRNPRNRRGDSSVVDKHVDSLRCREQARRERTDAREVREIDRARKDVAVAGLRRHLLCHFLAAVQMVRRDDNRSVGAGQGLRGGQTDAAVAAGDDDGLAREVVAALIALEIAAEEMLVGPLRAAVARADALGVGHAHECAIARAARDTLGREEDIAVGLTAAAYPPDQEALRRWIREAREVGWDHRAEAEYGPGRKVHRTRNCRPGPSRCSDTTSRSSMRVTRCRSSPKMTTPVKLFVCATVIWTYEASACRTTCGCATGWFVP